jgi:hypothetical protein
MANDAQKEFTSGGNPKAPSMDVYLQWIVDAWDSLTPEAITKSFKGLSFVLLAKQTFLLQTAESR